MYQMTFDDDSHFCLDFNVQVKIRNSIDMLINVYKNYEYNFIRF